MNRTYARITYNDGAIHWISSASPTRIKFLLDYIDVFPIIQKINFITKEQWIKRKI